MDKNEIFERIKLIRASLLHTNPDVAIANKPVSPETQKQYEKEARRLIGLNENGHFLPVTNAKTIVDKVRQAKTKSTLRKRARSVRFFAMNLLNQILKKMDRKQREGHWDYVHRTALSPIVDEYMKLAKMLPADYSQGWSPVRKRKGKKSSLRRLPEDWREQMAAASTGQYRLPLLVAMMTGCRPSELEKGILLERRDDGIFATIEGAKVTKVSGQSYRSFRLADHPLTEELKGIMSKSNNSGQMTVSVKNGNSLTTHFRSVGKKLWPRRKESITVYTARHGMAAQLKAAIAEGADPDLVSQVLGHIVDETASYYGNRFQAGGRSVVPSEVLVPKAISQKQRGRLRKRQNAAKRGTTS